MKTNKKLKNSKVRVEPVASEKPRLIKLGLGILPCSFRCHTIMMTVASKYRWLSFVPITAENAKNAEGFLQRNPGTGIS